ncbi:MAG TPA: cyclic nucleotide-binding domain-containing protein [Polyangia bacterium]|nr:cyclic nucleotide-binding domain-containing protein [Polyangia bacterium]
MSITLGEARSEARRLFQSGDYARALRAYDQILSAVPLDYEVRFKIADVLAKVGLTAEAAELYRTIALHDIRSGHPLPAIVACEALEALGQKADELLALLATTYASGSPHLGRFAVRPAPVAPETRLEPPDLLGTEPFDAVAERARQRALDLGAFTDIQQQFHPLPFFSELGHDAFLAVLRSLVVRRLEDRAVVTRQGEPGTALYLVASGEVRVVVADSAGEREIAHLFESSLFGEMALITDQPRSASVVVVGEADIIEVSKEALHRVTRQIPALKEVLDRFTRERLIKNLMQTSPLFTPFTKAQQSDLLRRFEGHEVEPGMEVIREGEPGMGLFVVLTGKLEVVAHAASGDPVVLARLQTGDICGEMSLLANQLTSATVRAVTRGTVLFLAREYVERLTAAIPEVRDYFRAVAAQRAEDNNLRLRGRSLPQDVTEVDASDVLLL